MKIVLTIKGTAPLIMHNIRLSNPRDPISRQMKEISSKRKKTDQDHDELARLEFAGGLYIDDAVGPYLPGSNIEKSIVEGARVTKQGKQVERGLFIPENVIPVLYAGPRDLTGLWEDGSYTSTMAVRVGQSRVMRTRPVFTEWAVEADAELDDTLLNVSSLQTIAADAGRMVGLGDYRPRYGRFEATVTVV